MSFLKQLSDKYKVTAELDTSRIKKEVEKLVLTGKYQAVGIRYENKKRSVGDICEDSKDNPNRDDSRDFPDYDSEEYDALPSMGGTSAWIIYREACLTDYTDEDDQEEILESLHWENLPEQSDHSPHIYIVGVGHDEVVMDEPQFDHNEIVMPDAEVLLVVK